MPSSAKAVIESVWIAKMAISSAHKDFLNFIAVLNKMVWRRRILERLLESGSAKRDA
jgi:hypothetical protein